MCMGFRPRRPRRKETPSPRRHLESYPLAPHMWIGGSLSANQLVIVRIVEKLPKTKDEIQRLIIAELRTCAECENAWGIIVVPLVDDLGIATWTVSRFRPGRSDAYACDRALQRIVPHYQRLYDLAQVQ